MIGPTGEIEQVDDVLLSEEQIKELIQQTESDRFIEDYEIGSSVDWISRHRFRIIGLQFPDELLPISVPVFRLLRSRLEDTVELYIMADTSYGSCCVDEVAAQHVSAEAIIHYGTACLSTTARLPVFYVLPRLNIPDHQLIPIAQSFIDTFTHCISHSSEPPLSSSNVLVMYDVGYHWKIDQIADCLRNQSDFLIAVDQISNRQDKNLATSDQEPLPVGSVDRRNNRSTMILPSTDTKPEFCEAESGCTQATRCCLGDQQASCPPLSLTTASQPASTSKTKLDLSSFQAIFYVGPESRRLLNLLVTHPSIPVFVTDPAQHEMGRYSCDLQTERTNKLLMRRYATIQRARDADVFGILVGTLGIRHYLDLIGSTKRLIEKTFSKKSYVVSVGKLKPEKLINFPEIECWVLIDCPENSLLMLDNHLKNGKFDPKLYGVPIITPFELEIGLESCIEDEDQRNKSWQGKLVLDFEELLLDWESNRLEINRSIEDNLPVFSIATGAYKHRKNWTSTNKLADEVSKELTRQIPINELIESVNGASSEYRLNQRPHFKGLERRIGLDSTSIMEIGRFGIAQEYGDDHHLDQEIKQ